MAPGYRPREAAGVPPGRASSVMYGFRGSGKVPRQPVAGPRRGHALTVRELEIREVLMLQKIDFFGEGRSLDKR
jgi:hypothetical protein